MLLRGKLPVPGLPFILVICCEALFLTGRMRFESIYIAGFLAAVRA